MPAYFDRGFMVREPAWHGLGIILPDYPGRDEARRLAGHDFEILERPLWIGGPVSTVGPVLLPNGAPLVESDEDSLYTPRRHASGWKGLVRADNGHLLSVQRSSYAVIQPSVIWDIADALVAQPNVRYETAGVLKDGAILWVLAWLDEPVRIPGDDSDVYPFVNVSTTNDGSGACRADLTSVRVVCWNTYSAATRRAEADGTSFTFRHTGKVSERISEVRHLMNNVRAEHRAFVELATELSNAQVTEIGVERFICEFLPEPAKVTERTMTNVNNRRDQVRSILAGPTIPDAHRRTAYGLVQAGVEFLDHFRGYHNRETYFARTVLRPESLKPQLVKLATSVAREYAVS